MKNYKFLIKIFFILIFQTDIALGLIQNKIIANVQNQIISNYELETKIRRILFFSNLELKQDNINQAKGRAIRSLIDSKLKKQELIKYKINLDNNESVDKYLSDLAKKYNTDLNGLKKIFLERKLNFKLFKEETVINLGWNKIIFDLYKNKINIDENEIDKELNEFIKGQKNIEEYELAEIEILLNNDQNDDIKIKEVLDEINLMGFKNTANKYSSSSSAGDGGNVGWINSKSLAGKLSNILKEMNSGDISKPIYQPNSVLIIKLLNKRGLSVNNLNLEELRANIITAKKNELLNLFSNNHLSKIKNNAFIEIK